MRTCDQSYSYLCTALWGGRGGARLFCRLLAHCPGRRLCPAGGRDRIHVRRQVVVIHHAERREKEGGRERKTHTQTHTRSWSMTNVSVAFPPGRAARVWSPGIYLVTGRLGCKPLLLCSARILWMNQDCTIRGGGRGGSDWQPTGGPTFQGKKKKRKRLLFWHSSSCIYFLREQHVHLFFSSLLDLIAARSPRWEPRSSSHSHSQISAPCECTVGWETWAYL